MTKLLIVDDSEQNLFMLQALLQGYGYDVESATNGVVALEAARRDPPDMIISDILMPVMDGFSLCREWKQDERLKGIPFVFYTATYTDPKDEKFALSLGAERFLVKPIEPDEFIGILQEVIEAHQVGQLVARRELVKEETVYLKAYNETLIRKLEDKNLQLEEVNRDLEREITERKQAEAALQKAQAELELRVSESAADLVATNQQLQREITERVLTETALKKRNEFIETIIDNLPIGLAVNEVDTGIATYMNRRFEEIYGWPRDTLSSVEAFFNHVFPDPKYRQEMQEIILSDISSGDSARMRWENIAATAMSGEERIVTAVNIPLPEQNLMISTVQDVTERQKAEEALQKAHDELEIRVFDRTAELAKANEALQAEIAERKWAEEALQENEARLQSIFRAAPAGIGLVSNRIFLQVNDRICEMTGYSSDELVGQSARMLYPTDEEFEHIGREKYAQISQRGTGTVETRWKRKDDQVIEILLSSTPLDPTDLSVGVTFTALDITERKRANEALRESEKRYHALFEEAPVMYLTVRDEEETPIISNCNAAFLNTLGYSRDEVVGTPLADFYVPGSRVALLEGGGFQQAIEGKMKMPVERNLATRDGRSIAALLRAVPEINEAGQIVGTRAMFTDITERKRAEEELRTKEYIIESASSVIATADLEGIMTYGNPAFFETWGFSDAEEVLGRHFSEFWLVKDRLDEINGALWNEGRWSGEAKARRADSSIFDVQVLAAVVLDKAGQPVSLMSSSIDITERKRTEEALRQAHEELTAKATALEAANAELEQYAYVVSHDLRAPLRAIHNYADFLREDLAVTLDGDQKAYLDGLGSAVREAEELVGDLLTLSRIGRRSVPLETINLGAFLRELITTHSPSADVEIVMPEDWPTIEVEPVLLGQIFQNLIGNAIKFNRSPQKRVELSWRPAGEQQIELWVRDNGIGIEPRYHEQIFRVFERLHTSAEYQGTGIGLAIVKKAVAKLDGSVRVESKPGEGSTFLVTLPR